MPDTTTDDVVREAVATCTSMRQVLRALGLSTRSGWTRKKLGMRIVKLGLDTTHWRGQGHLKGKKAPWVKARRTPLEEVLVSGRPTSNRSLRVRLIEEGLLEEACAVCGISEWQRQPLTLHLDHVNGDNSDNRLENLRLLCPNCHSQTDTYCGKNWGRYLGDD